jgi:hypothetical protein
MTKFILRVFSWLFVVGVCSAQSSGGAQNGRLTHDLTVGAAHDIQLKGGQTVQVLSQSASTVVIMVQLSDGSNGVYQLAPGDVQMIQQEDAAPHSAANSTAAGGVMAAPTGNEMPTLSQINSLPRRLSLVAAVSPQNLDIKTGSDEKLQIDALPKGTVLTPLDVQGDNIVVSIHGRIVSSELVDPNWNNTSLNVTVAPHTVTRTREVMGRGLIPLSDTDYSQLVAQAAQVETQQVAQHTANGPYTGATNQQSGETSVSPSPPTIGDGVKTFTFTTKDGKKYENVKVDVTDTGLSMITSDGGTTVSFDQLPDDLSIFPDYVRRLITEKRQSSLTQGISPQSQSSPQPGNSATNGLNAATNGNTTGGELNLNAYLEETLTQPTTSESMQAHLKKLDEFNSLFDQGLPPDVLTALKFIRGKIRSDNHIVILRDKGLLVMNCDDGPYIVSIKELDPNDIVEKSRSSAYADDTAEYWLEIHATGRTPRITCYSHGSLALPSNATSIAFYLDDESLCSRVANAFADIIRYYGGQPEPSIDDAKTPDQLVKFIQERLAKGDPSRSVDFTFDPKTDDVKLTYGGYFGTDQGGQSMTIKITNMKPDDFQWEKSGDNPSKLDVGLYEEVPVQGGVVKAPTKLKCANEQDASDVASAFTRLCTMSGWEPSKY